MKPRRAWLAYLGFLAERSFWLVPAVLTVSAAGLAAATLLVDEHVTSTLESAPRWLAPTGAEGARAVLATIASSMITVASLVFSLTLVALSVTSSQLGPRLLQTFMLDRRNQIPLGTFIATFVYSVIVLRTIGDAESTVVPHVSVTVALVGALGSFGALIYFIHHVAESMQADTVIARVSGDLRGSLERHLEEHARDDAGEPGDRQGSRPTMPSPDGEATAEIRAEHTGYVQAIDRAALVELGDERDLRLRLHRPAGDFVVHGTTIATLWPDGRVDDDVAERVRASVVLGPTRTPVQDIEFSIRQMTEIALRALSPGVNDPHTAVACVDHLAGGIAFALRHPLPDGVLCGADGRARVELPRVTLSRLLDTAFAEIRSAARDQESVSRRILDRVADLLEVATTEEQREALRSLEREVHHAISKRGAYDREGEGEGVGASP